jgi:hypothetical protein
MPPSLHPTLARTVLLPAALLIAGSVAPAAAASAPPPVITAAGSSGVPAAPAAPDSSMPGMDMSRSDGTDPMPGMDMGGPTGSGSISDGTSESSSPGSRALVLGGFAAVNAGVLLGAAIVRQRSPRGTAALARRLPVGVAISRRPGDTAELARVQPEGASS